MIKYSLIILIHISLSFFIRAENISINKKALVGKWKLVSANVIDAATKEKLDASNLLFRDMLLYNKSIAFTNDGLFIFQKDKIPQSWKFELLNNNIIHLIEPLHKDDKEGTNHSYIDYKIEQKRKQLILRRIDNALIEEYFFLTTK